LEHHQTSSPEMELAHGGATDQNRVAHLASLSFDLSESPAIIHGF
jgi:hypothetical protein